jgi:hypothetical protein
MVVSRCFPGPDGAETEHLFGLGQYCVNAGLILCYAGTLGRFGLRLALGLFSLLGKESLIIGVNVPRGLPDSPDEVFDLTSRDGDPHPSVRAERPRGTRSPDAKHVSMEPHEPGVLARLILPRALRTVRRGATARGENVARPRPAMVGVSRAYAAPAGVLPGHQQQYRRLSLFTSFPCSSCNSCIWWATVVEIFISHAGLDRAWAEWVAWQLRSAGHSVELDLWHWGPGDNFIVKMQNALERAQRVVVLLSRAYFEEERFTTMEWTAVLAGRNAGQRLLPLRIEDVAVPSLFQALIHKDLFGLDQVGAREALFDAISGPHSPTTEPAFPQRNLGLFSTGNPNTAPPRLPGTLPAIWNVPPRSLVFTGRQRTLVTLRNQLGADGKAVVQALHGIGGVGKTALAVEYAHRFAGSYDFVWWVDAEQISLVGEQLANLGIASGWVENDVATPRAATLVQRHLRTETGWLIIFDNAELPADLAPWLPQGAGHILITSRNTGWRAIAAQVDVDVFSRQESSTLLRRLAPTLSRNSAAQLAQALGDLPLALAQAGGIVADTGMPPDEYLEVLRTQALEVMSLGRPLFYSLSLAASVRASVDRLRNEDVAAVQMLQLSAFLAPDPIPVGFFIGVHDYEFLPEPLRTVARATSALGLRRSLELIGRYGLAKVGQETIQMHRLTQAIIRDLVASDLQSHLRSTVETLLASANPHQPAEPANWPAWSRLMPHLFAVRASTSGVPGLRELATDACSYLLERGDIREAFQFASDLRVSWTNLLGPDHEHTLTISRCMARAYWERGDYAQAVDLDEDTLRRRRHILGNDHIDTLTTAHSLAVDLRELAIVTSDQLAVERACELDRDTLERARRTLGEDHQFTLVSATGLSADVRALGRPHEARTLDEDTYARSRRILGEDHPFTLRSASNLAADFLESGDAQKARQLDEDTLARRRRMLGANHPQTLRSATNLAAAWRALNEPGKARELDEDTLSRRRRLLGDDHPQTLLSASNLAADLLALGKTEERPLPKYLTRGKAIKDNPDVSLVSWSSA